MSEDHPTQNSSTTTEPDVLDDLDEMWPELANAEGRRWKPGEMAAVMLLAAQEIRELRERLEALNV